MVVHKVDENEEFAPILNNAGDKLLDSGFLNQFSLQF